jgi:hypothetical protein
MIPAEQLHLLADVAILATRGAIEAVGDQDPHRLIRGRLRMSQPYQVATHHGGIAESIGAVAHRWVPIGT